MFRGEELVYQVRLVQGLAGEGMIIFPCFDSLGTIAALDSEEGRRFLASQPVTGMRLVVGEDDNWLFPRGRSNRHVAPAIEVDFFRLEFAERDSRSANTEESMKALMRLLALQPTESQTPPVLTTATGAVLKARPDSLLRLSLGPGVRSVKLNHGLLGNSGASADFSVSLDPNGGGGGEPQLLWSATVSGGGNGSKIAIVPLPDLLGEGAALILFGKASGGGIAFWTDVVPLE